MSLYTSAGDLLDELSAFHRNNSNRHLLQDGSSTKLISNISDITNYEKIKHLSPMDKIRLEEKMILEVVLKYRLSILRTVGTFSHLSPEIVEATAHCLDELKYDYGDEIIRQDDGSDDGFFILQEGDVKVTKKKNSNDKREIETLLATLGKNSTFGEVALLTDEPRSATVTVTSPEGAICLRLRKKKFLDLMANKNKVVQEARSTIASDVINIVPIFQGITGSQKQRLINSMVPMDFWPNSYICRQGTIGATFYIITEGTCRVTIFTEDDKELDVAKLTVGDFFGEIALMELSNKRTANVISLDNVHVLSLAKSEFQKLFKNLKNKFLENQAVKRMVGINVGQPIELLKKRRVSAFDHHNLKNKDRVKKFYMRFTKLVVEALWSSLYSRMYVQLCLIPKKAAEFGGLVENIMASNPVDRWATIKMLQAAVVGALMKAPTKRDMRDHLIVIGCMSQRNELRRRICKDWSRNEYIGLCRKVTFERFLGMKKIFEVDSKCSKAYLILRGSIRVFKRIKVGYAYKMVYEEDLISGDVLGEDCLTGVTNRAFMAFSLTAVDLIAIDYNDFVESQDRATSLLTQEERAEFLSHVPLFKSWEVYKLSRLAFVLLQLEAFKGQVIVKRRSENRDLIFLLNGRVDVVTNTTPAHTITTVCKYEYFGETGFLNSRVDTRDPDQHMQYETFNIVAQTRVDILVLPYEKFEWLTECMYKSCQSGYLEKVKWRKARNETILYEKRHGLEASTTVMLEAIRKKRAKDKKKKAEEEQAAILQKELDVIPEYLAYADSEIGDMLGDALDSGRSSASENSSLTQGSTISNTSLSIASSQSTHNSASHLRPIVEEGKQKISSYYHSPTLTHDLDPLVEVKEVSDLEDIPTLLYKGYDPLMVFPTLHTFKDTNAMRENLKSVQGPKIIRAMKKSAKKESDDGFYELSTEFFDWKQIVSTNHLEHKASLESLAPKSIHNMDKSYLNIPKPKQRPTIPMLPLSPPLKQPIRSAEEPKLPFGVNANKLSSQRGILKR